ncbi:MAG: ABC transporter substrate-binding protein [Desulfatirhabdiaceae bacterium]
MFFKPVRVILMVGFLFSIVWCGVGFAKEPVMIGLTTSLSGTFAPQGEEVRRAVEFAIEEANAKGGVDGREVKVQLNDDESTPDGARKGMEKCARSGYNLLIGPIASSMSLTLAQNLERWDAMYCIILSKADKLTGEACIPRMFRINPSDSMDLAMMSSWLRTINEKKFAILAVDYAWGRDSAEFFKKTAPSMGKEVKTELFVPMGTKDFAPYIAQLADSGAEAVWVALVGRDIMAFAKQADEFGLKKKMRIVGHAFIFNFVVNATGQASEGIWGNIGYSPSISTERNKQYVAAWKKKFDREPTENEGQAYNGTQVIFEGVKAAGSVKPVDVARALSGATIETIFGPAKMRAEDHQLMLPNYIGQVEKINDQYKVVVEKSFDASVNPPPSTDCKMGNLQ